MSYTGPAGRGNLERSLRKFQIFLFATVALFLIIIISITKYHTFWEGNILWGVGSTITMAAIIELRYFDIRRKGNPQNLRINLAQTFQPESDRKKFERWLKLEKAIQYSWVIGAVLVIISRWILF